jgi:glycosyltransferase involved in cell wall biosynthesis
MKKPLVSICVQTYNHKDYIKQCLDGILMQQTTFPFEIILGEDESNDGTREICIPYANKYPDKIKLFLRSRKDVIYINGNPTGRYNFIENLKACQGKYIALCDGDDYWTDPLKLQKQVDFLEAHNKFDIVFTNGKVVYSGNDISPHLIYCNNDTEQKGYQSFKIPDDITDVHILAKGNFIHTAGVVFRNQFLNNSLPNYMTEVTIGDWPLYMSIAKESYIKYFNDDTFCYRIHSRGIYSEKSNISKTKMSLGQFAPMINENYFNDDVEEIIWDYCYKTIVSYLNQCNSEEDYQYFIDFLGDFKKVDQIFYSKLVLNLFDRYKRISMQNKTLKQRNSFVVNKRIKKIIKQLFS